MSSSEKDVSMQKVEEETNELRKKYPLHCYVIKDSRHGFKGSC